MEDGEMILTNVKEVGDCPYWYLKRHYLELMVYFSPVKMRKVFSAVRNGFINVAICQGDCPANLPSFRLMADKANTFMVNEWYGIDLTKCDIYAEV